MPKSQEKKQRRQLDKDKFTDRQSKRAENEPETDQDVAERLKKGAPMTGVSQFAGLAGSGDSSNLAKGDNASPEADGSKKQEGNKGRHGALGEDERKEQFKAASPGVQKYLKDKGLAPDDQNKQKDQKEKPADADNKEADNKEDKQQGQGEQAGGPGEQKQTKQERTQKAIEQQKKEIDAAKAKKKEAAKQTLEAKEQGKHFKRALNYARYRSSKKAIKRGEKRLKKLERTSELQNLTSALLRNSWLHLIDSWGATIFYICFHFLMAYFTPFSHFFCEFGEEWGIIRKMKKKSEAAAKKLSKPLEVLESSCCIGICGCLALIFGIIFLLAALPAYVWFETNLLEKLAILVKIVWRTLRNLMGLPIE